MHANDYTRTPAASRLRSLRITLVHRSRTHARTRAYTLPPASAPALVAAARASCGSLSYPAHYRGYCTRPKRESRTFFVKYLYRNFHFFEEHSLHPLAPYARLFYNVLPLVFSSSGFSRPAKGHGINEYPMIPGSNVKPPRRHEGHHFLA